MQITIDRSKLAGKSVTLATPMYGGNCKGEFARCVMDLALLCKDLGVPFETQYLYNASLIGRGRNDLTRSFLAGNHTHMLFVDADIVFDPIDVIACLAQDKELIGGPYPMKTVDFTWLKDVVVAKPDIEPGDLEKLARFYHFNYLPGQPLNFDPSQLLEVMNVSTGFMLIARPVFAAIRAQWPDEVYLTDYARDQAEGKTYEVYNYFACPVEEGRLLSEDYYFCKRWKETGGKIWLAPWMRMRHIGDFTYGGLGVVAAAQADAMVEAVRSWRGRREL